MKQKFIWPPQAVYDILHEIEGARGWSREIGGEWLDLMVSHLKYDYEDNKKFCPLLTRQKVEEKLKSLWKTYKAEGVEKDAPLQLLLDDGLAVLDWPRLKKPLKTVYEDWEIRRLERKMRNWRAKREGGELEDEFSADDDEEGEELEHDQHSNSHNDDEASPSAHEDSNIDTEPDDEALPGRLGSPSLMGRDLLG